MLLFTIYANQKKQNNEYSEKIKTIWCLCKITKETYTLDLTLIYDTAFLEI